MGSIQSYLSSQSAVLVVVAVGAVVYVVAQRVLSQPPPPPSRSSPSPTPTDSATQTAVPGASTSSGGGKKNKKNKKQLQAANEAPSDTNVLPAGKANVVSFPPVIPGSFEPAQAEAQPAAEPAPKSTKSKKKKGKKAGTAVTGGAARTVPTDAQSDSSATAPESHSRPTKKKSPAPKPAAPSLLENDGPWTRVEPRKRTASQQAAEGSTSSNVPRPSESDAGITSVTGTSSSVADRTEDEAQAETSRPEVTENRRTLAEKLLPKPRRTGVDDMLETPDVPSLARVMRVQPRPDERPAAGFSWADYEDVDESRQTADDADGEDESGWVVKNSRTRPINKANSPQSSQNFSAPESLTKKQRQNAAKREAQKSLKANAEAERLAVLARHKREVEKAKMVEQHALKGKKPSGGMSSYVNEKGQLVWD
ncbi:unnamed protein product [Somion occarium]|uniref:Uncharacterized protein n=1 Tax=Somion occarium TaxID=3059160 RepID=A0ABP1E7Y9_9APHY